MTKKEELIIGILNKDLKNIKSILKDQKKMINNIRKNGMEDTHQSYRISIPSGLNYTLGCCTAHINLAEEVIELLGMSDTEIEALLEDNRIISAENKIYLDGVSQLLTKY